MIRPRLLTCALAAVFAAALAAPTPAHASAPGLQVTPLQYEDTLSGKPKSGHIDVANPTDSTITVASSVRGFNQIGTDGDLRFFDDQELPNAIHVDLTDFSLGPHEAVRVGFTVDPAKLSSGGVYAAIFFRTAPADQSSQSSYIVESANVGTLLLLNNHGDSKPAGGLTQLVAPRWQTGDGLTATAAVLNTGSAHGGVAFRPSLTARVVPWGATVAQPTGLVLPAASRHFAVSRPGSFFGPLPLTVTDAATHTTRTVWIFAITGYWRWLAPILLVIILLLPVKIFSPLRRIFRGKPKPSAKPTLDGLSRKVD